MKNETLTPYPEINVAILDLLSGVRDILGNNFVGLYLHGSLATGDFDLAESDIDFVVVASDEVTAEQLPALTAMHTRLAARESKWGAELEGPYIPRQALRHYDSARARHPYIEGGGSLRVEPLGSDWIIQRHVLRVQGVTVIGPPPETLIDPVGPEELRRAVRAILQEWWARLLDDSSKLRHRPYQAYAILTMCRALYVLEYGTLASKPVAARWAQVTLGERWTAVIERALTRRHDETLDDLDATRELIRYTLERSQQ